MLENDSQYTVYFVWFVILFPSTIAILFFITLWFKREGLYSPSDFREDTSFLSLIRKKVERLDLRQEAAQVDPRGSIKEILHMLQKLVSSDEIDAAIHLSKAPLKIGHYKSSLECFKYLEGHVPPTYSQVP